MIVVRIESDNSQLKQLLETAKAKQKLIFMEIRCKIGFRKDPGRPTTTSQENKIAFMEYLAQK